MRAATHPALVMKGHYLSAKARLLSDELAKALSA
jgi:hypothetical protein